MEGGASIDVNIKCVLTVREVVCGAAGVVSLKVSGVVVNKSSTSGGRKKPPAMMNLGKKYNLNVCGQEILLHSENLILCALVAVN